MCIDACNDCAAECEHCATACLNEPDATLQSRCIALNRFCADMCRMAVAFMSRSDEHTINFVNKFRALCAEICTACADKCGKHTHLEHCIKCAEACRKCAADCNQMSKSNNLQSEHVDFFPSKAN
ncbi:four-helix bundle copper-binding protein [Flavobacterium sp.]|uniref:four-helix bundle copper-binding protein n=1 Tax=Flavobacterium sp. TaxID=239 RepID=UPI00286E8A7B|nr:four-helix bundle copper-binding protein [Flavobacterium sp.]